MLQFHVERLEATVYRVPIATPVRTSFGTMHDRPAVLVRVIDRDGAEGWGEIWCNFPSVGAEHRARLATETVAPLLTDRPFSSPEEAFRHLDARLRVLAIQSGEPGPLAQVVAGIDIALWDLAARKAGRPVYRMLGAEVVESLPVYASGLNPDRPDVLAAARRDEGFRAFKLKIGFGRDRDLANLEALRAELGEAAELMVDANQGWTVETATEMAARIEPFRLGWLEEPLPADAPRREWQAVRQASGIPIAAGENLRGPAFDEAMGDGIVQVLQPDIAKWGGFSGCLPMARKAREAGLRLCPHWLGGGTGLVASLHLLAAVGGDGMVEVDANPNPLREMMAAPHPSLDEGRMRMPQDPGLGVVPDLVALEPYRVRL